ncbi:MAG: InlB B-repeat-containing protein [Treponemataceae bacterium]
MKKSIFSAFAALVILTGLFTVSCANPLAGNTNETGNSAQTESGVLTVTIGNAGSSSAARTIVPGASDLPAIASYDLTLTSAGATTRTTTFTALTGSISLLVPGTWTVAVSGKTASGIVVASGTTDVVITASASAAVTVNLAYIAAAASSSGSMALTLVFPKSIGINGIYASLDGVAISPALAIADNGDALNDKVVCSVSGLTTASTLLRMGFKKDGVVLLTWAERVWIFKDITTTNSSVLAVSSFNAKPDAPASLTPGSLQPDGTVTLSWPNVGTAETYKLERSENAGAGYSVIQAALAAGTLSYTDTLPVSEKTYKYRLSATNTFGTSASTVSTADVAVTPVFIVAYDKTALEVVFQGAETPSSILNNLNLAASGSTGTIITWVFTTSAIAADGTVTRPDFTEFPTGNSSGTLTATITNNGVSVTKDFPLTVIRKPGVSFDANSGTGTTTALAIPTGNTAALTPNSFSKTGHSFAGWATTAGGTAEYANGGDYLMTSTVPVILYAKWTANTYAVSFDSQGGSAASGLNVTYAATYGTLPTSTRTGYTFCGWYTGTGGTGTNITAGTMVAITAAQTLYAKWTAINYSISYSLAGGTNAGGNPSTYTIESGTITPAAPTRSSYIFTGWTPGSIATGSTGNKTFTASWVLAPYTITYNVDGGTNAAGNPATYTSSTPRPLVFAAPTRSGFAFSGWFSNATCTNPLPALQSSTSGNIVLYAKWTAVSATNPALGCWVTTSGTETGYDLPGYYAVDGNDATRWSSQKPLSVANPAWIALDLGSPQGICSITIHWEAAPSGFYYIESSVDGINWSNVWTNVGPANYATSIDNWTWALTARYWRVYATATRGTAGISIYEITLGK